MEERDYTKEAEKAFAMRRNAIFCLYAALVSGFFLPGIHIWLSIIPAFFIVSFFVLSLKYWRCPSCHKAFEMRHGAMDNATHCPHCGVRIKY